MEQLNYKTRKPHIYGYEEIKEETNRRKREALALINSQPLTKFYTLQRSKAGAYICPICGSGTGQNHTGALSIDDNNRVTCFALNCFGSNRSQGTDTAGALAIIEGVELSDVLEKYAGFNWRETFREIKTELYSTGKIERTATQSLQEVRAGELEPPVKEEAEEIRHDYTDFILKCFDNLKKSPQAQAYLLRRGLNKKTIERNKLGLYIDKEKKGYIVLPYSGGFYYILRRIRTDDPGKKYRKPKTSEAGREPLHHPEYLLKNEPVIICEGYFDALSIEQAGNCRAIPLNGTGAPGRLVKVIEELNSKTPFIIALDNDKKTDGSNPGQEGQKRLVEVLKELGHPYIEYNIQGEAKDANELLVKDPDQLTSNIKKAIKALEDQVNILGSEGH